MVRYEFKNICEFFLSPLLSLGLFGGWNVDRCLKEEEETQKHKEKEEKENEIDLKREIIAEKTFPTNCDQEKSENEETEKATKKRKRERKRKRNDKDIAILSPTHSNPLVSFRLIEFLYRIIELRHVFPMDIDPLFPFLESLSISEFETLPFSHKRQALPQFTQKESEKDKKGREEKERKSSIHLIENVIHYVEVSSLSSSFIVNGYNMYMKKRKRIYVYIKSFVSGNIWNYLPIYPNESHLKREREREYTKKENKNRENFSHLKDIPINRL